MRAVFITAATLLLLPAVAMAWESEPRELFFEDDIDVFSALDFDTGFVPSGSPLMIRFFLLSEGGVYTEMQAISTLEWPDPLTHTITGVPDTGWFEFITDIQLGAQFQLDLFGYNGTWDIFSLGLFMEDGVEFPPLLLAGSPVNTLELGTIGQALFDPISYTFNLFTGVDLRVNLEVLPAARTFMQGKYIESTTGSRNEHVISIMDTEGVSELIPPPVVNPGSVDLESTYVADLEAALDFILRPSLEVCVTILGCFRVLQFDIPVPLLSYADEHRFDALNYSHPIPALRFGLEGHDFGEVEVGNLANLMVGVENLGEMHLTGNAWILGNEDTFDVFPEYFLAGQNTIDGFVLTFAPEDVGPFEATLVLESNDPLQPLIQIPITGEGLDDRQSRLNVIIVNECGCTTTDPAHLRGTALMALVVLAVIARPRRRR